MKYLYITQIPQRSERYRLITEMVPPNCDTITSYTCRRIRLRSPVLTALFTLSPCLLLVSMPSVAQQSSSMHVTVIDDRGAAVPAADVHIVSLPDLIGLPTPDGTFSFKNVAPGTYRVSATYPGFRDETVSDVVVVEGKTTDVKITLEQGPPKASDYRIHQNLDDVKLYSKPLSDIGQPPLCSEAVGAHNESYRFMWVPTFEHPAFLRVDIDSDGAATLLTHVWSGAGGYEWGKSVKNARKLTPEEQSDLFETLADLGFWTLPSQVDRPPNVVVLDGTEWLIEGVKDGKCHVVSRYSSPLTELVEKQFLARVARLKPYYKSVH